MSKEILDKAATVAATTTAADAAASPEKRRSTVPDILRHQKSFEHRYSSIINKQILKTSINMDELHRQMNAFFPFSRAASLANEGDTMPQMEDNVVGMPQADAASGTDVKVEAAIGTTEIEKTKKDAEAMAECFPEMPRSLEKQPTMDIADQNQKIIIKEIGQQCV